MNTKQLADRLLRHCTPRKAADLTMEQRQELLGAMSAGIGLFFRLAPHRMKRTTASYTLPAPTTISVEVTNGSTTTTAGNPFTTDQRGATIIIAGDDRHNEITARNGLLNAYQGTTGTQSATLYGDAVPIHSRLIERLVTEPILVESSGVTHQLRRAQSDHAPDSQPAITGTWHRGGALACGQPLTYGIQQGGGSHGSDLNFLLRIRPLPDRLYVVQFDIEAAPETYALPHLQGEAVNLPLSEDQLESIVIPLCEREMMSTTLWSADDNTALLKRLEDRADRAISQIALLPQDFAKPQGRVRVAHGW